jgi:hypothetical protein
VPATDVVGKIIIAAKSSVRATTRSSFAIWLIAEQQTTLSANQLVDDALMPRKIAFGREALRMVTTIDCAYVRSLVFVHVLAGCAED